MSKGWCYIKRAPQYNSVARALSSKGKTWDVGDTINIVFLNGSQREKSVFKRAAADLFGHINLSVSFDKVNVKDSDIRARFGRGGNWSWLGTDALLSKTGEPTINIENVDYPTCLHELMHAVGFRHEHQHPDRPFNFIEKNVIKDLSGPPNNWGIGQIRHNVLDKAKRSEVIYSDYDDESITCYFWPDSWIEGGKGTRPNKKLSKGDIKHLKKLYPFPK